MTLSDLILQLKAAQQALANAPDADPIQKIDLNIAVLQAQRAVVFGGFEALADTDNETKVDASMLPGLVTDLQTAIQNEQNFEGILNKILAVAKVAIPGGVL